jgi:hypothetical protein
LLSKQLEQQFFGFYLSALASQAKGGFGAVKKKSTIAGDKKKWIEGGDYRGPGSVI